MLLQGIEFFKGQGGVRGFSGRIIPLPVHFSPQDLTLGFTVRVSDS